jgi:glycosyltransferase involved in cell wall biosynthesis
MTEFPAFDAIYSEAELLAKVPDELSPFYFLNPDLFPLIANLETVENRLCFYVALFLRRAQFGKEFSTLAGKLFSVLEARLATPVYDDTVFAINQFQVLFYQLRPDAHPEFSLAQLAERKRFLAWFHLNVMDEFAGCPDFSFVEGISPGKSFDRHGFDYYDHVTIVAALKRNADTPHRNYLLKLLLTPRVRSYVDLDLNNFWIFQDHFRGHFNQLELLEQANQKSYFLELLSPQYDGLGLSPDIIDFLIRNSLRSFDDPEIQKRAAQFLLQPLKPDTDLPKPAGVTAVGYATAELGMGEEVRMTTLALHDAGIPVNAYEVFHPGKLRLEDHRIDSFLDNKKRQAITIFNLPAVETYRLVYSSDRELLKRPYRIGFWQWELLNFNAKLKFCFDVVDEVWCPTRFIFDSHKDLTSKPIFLMPSGMDLGPVEKVRRGDFGLDENKFWFLCMFDGYSYLGRKNPVGAIEAFKKAFPVGKQDVGLAIKVINGNESSPAWKQMMNVIDGDSRFKIINKFLTRPKLLGLVNVCDAFVSLHRSEGFGRCIAEAMMLQKPVVVTNFSGNTDFNREGNSFLVDFKLVASHETEYPYAENNFWADPKLDSAIAQMKLVFENREMREEKALLGRKTIEDEFSVHAVGVKYAARIKDILAQICR